MNGFVTTPPNAVVDNAMAETFVPRHVNTPVAESNGSLRESVRQCVKKYMAKLDGQDPKGLWDMVAEEVEIPLIRTILEYTKYNQSKAAIWLGISRGTLRKKMAQYNIDKIED